MKSKTKKILKMVGGFYLLAIVAFGIWYSTSDKASEMKEAYKTNKAKFAEAAKKRELQDITRRTMTPQRITGFCSKMRELYKAHAEAKNRIKQTEVFAEYKTFLKKGMFGTSGPAIFEDMPLKLKGLEVEKAVLSNGQDAVAYFDICPNKFFDGKSNLYIQIKSNNVSKTSKVYASLSEFKVGQTILVSGTVKLDTTVIGMDEAQERKALTSIDLSIALNGVKKSN